MDIKEYISSGILEQYVLGSVSAQERQEVECLSAIYPEIKEELTDMQSTLERFAIQSEVAPPKELKDRIMDAIAEIEQVSGKQESQKPNLEKPTVQKTSAKVISIGRKWAAVAVVVIVATIAVLGVLNYENQQDLASTQDELEQQKIALNEQNEELANLRQESIELAAVNSVLTDPTTQRVQMNGTGLYPEGMAQIFWNAEDQKVLMDKGNMPAPPQGQDYQLWAIVDGTPQSLGVYPWSASEEQPKIMLGEVESAAAFAVTLEPKGGSETPTMSNLFVIGEV